MKEKMYIIEIYGLNEDVSKELYKSSIWTTCRKELNRL